MLLTESPTTIYDYNAWMAHEYKGRSLTSAFEFNDNVYDLKEYGHNEPEVIGTQQGVRWFAINIKQHCDEIRLNWLRKTYSTSFTSQLNMLATTNKKVSELLSQYSIDKILDNCTGAFRIGGRDIKLTTICQNYTISEWVGNINVYNTKWMGDGNMAIRLSRRKEDIYRLGFYPTDNKTCFSSFNAAHKAHIYNTQYGMVGTIWLNPDSTDRIYLGRFITCVHPEKKEMIIGNMYQRRYITSATEFITELGIELYKQIFNINGKSIKISSDDINLRMQVNGMCRNHYYKNADNVLITEENS